MRARTPKRAAQEREYRKLAAQFLADHPECECCGGMAAEVHHRRGRRGADLLDQAHWSALCSGCHRTVTVEPAWALSVGLSEPRIGRAS